MSDAVPYLRNYDDLPWEDFSGGRFGSEDKLLTEGLSARQLDAALTRLAPGQVNCPYHFHHIGEELFIVLEGTGELRYDGKTHRLKPHDVITCPAGPGSAHQIVNDGSEPLVYLAISTEPDYEICEYPDSDKTMVYGKGAARLKRVFRNGDAVDYMAGEQA